jgi:surfeit locus 1 family protein
MRIVLPYQAGILVLRWGFTLFVLCGVLGLCTLSVWQLQRGAQKHALIATMQARMQQPPQPLASLLATANPDWAALEYRRVTVTGVLQHDKELHLAARELRYSTYGYQILTPLALPEQRGLLVNRGWVPAEKKAAASRAEGQSAGTVTLTGILRLPKPRGWMVPENAPERNVWLWLDLPAMAQTAAILPVLPMVLDVDASPNAGGWPVGGQTRVSFPDNHLQYALTWGALALALLVIGLIAQWQRPRPDGL